MLNQVNLIGHLGNDPEIVKFDNGGQIAKVSLATSETYKDNEGNKVDKTEWHNLIFNGKASEVVEKYLKKGAKIYASGKIQTRKWKIKEGENRYTTEIIVKDFKFLDSKKNENNNQNEDLLNDNDDLKSLPF